MSIIELAEKLIQMINAIADMNAPAMDSALTDICTAINLAKPYTFTTKQTYDTKVVHDVMDKVTDGIKAFYKNNTAGEVKQWTE